MRVLETLLIVCGILTIVILTIPNIMKMGGWRTIEVRYFAIIPFSLGIVLLVIYNIRKAKAPSFPEDEEWMDDDEI